MLTAKEQIQRDRVRAVEGEAEARPPRAPEAQAVGWPGQARCGFMLMLCKSRPAVSG